MNEEVVELGDWYRTIQPYFTRGASDLESSVKRLLDDWAAEYMIEVVGVSTPRIKTLARTTQKVQRYIDEGRTVNPGNSFNVKDLLGIRVVVRGLSDLENLRIAFAEQFELCDLAFDDKVHSPTVTGYRALHADGMIRTRIAREEVDIPFEVQVKTLAQDIWGSYTHHDAYSRLDLREDARFERVNRLQRIISDQLACVDALHGEISELTQDIAHEITESPLDSQSPLDYAGVVNVVHTHMDQVVLGAPAVDAILQATKEAGGTTVGGLANIIAGYREAAAAALVEDLSRSPHPLEVVLKALHLSSVDTAAPQAVVDDSTRPEDSQG